MPRVMELGVTSSSAVSEPRTAATATTHFAGFLDVAAFRAYGTDGRRRRRRDSCWVYMSMGQRHTKGGNAVSVELTFAGFHALKPPVINVFVA